MMDGRTTYNSRHNSSRLRPETRQPHHPEYHPYDRRRRRCNRRKSMLWASVPYLVAMLVLGMNGEEEIIFSYLNVLRTSSAIRVDAFSVAIPRTSTHVHRRYRFEYLTSLGNVQVPQVTTIRSEPDAQSTAPSSSSSKVNGENRSDLIDETEIGANGSPNVEVAVGVGVHYSLESPSATRNGYKITAAAATTTTATATSLVNGHSVPNPHIPPVKLRSVVKEVALFEPSNGFQMTNVDRTSTTPSSSTATATTSASPSLTPSSSIPASSSTTSSRAAITLAADAASAAASSATSIPSATSSASVSTVNQSTAASNQPTTVTATTTSSPPTTTTTTTTRSMWRRRNARSAEEGIRREKTTQLSTLFAKASTQFALAQQQLQKSRSNLEAAVADVPNNNNPRYAARTLTGLIHALAEEADDLDVQVESRNDTPLWGKHVDAVRIQFSRLGFKPLRMGGLIPRTTTSSKSHPKTQRKNPTVINGQVLESTTPSSTKSDVATRVLFPDTRVGAFTMGRQLTDLSCADEAFERIDVDNSGALDTDEIAEALTMAASTAAAVDAVAAADSSSSSSDDSNNVDSQYYLDRLTEPTNLEYLRQLASELVALYDFNGDGVVDRNEYQSMVEDMAALRDEQERLDQEQQQQQNHLPWFFAIPGWVASAASTVTGWFHRQSGEDLDMSANLVNEIINGEPIEHRDVEIVSGANVGSDPAAKAIGSITFSDLKLDLRRLLFGAIPIVKHIMPGGPLILEPFTTTVVGSFNQDDIKKSFLLDAGLRRLVAQALKRRVRSLRDLMDGAIFHGRSWKMSSETAPSVQVLELTDVEFDDQNKLILTGRVRVQPRQEVPVIENAFKLRTKIGTRRDGRFIRLVEPELALVLECPKAWEETVGRLCDVFGFDRPCRPEPIYSFFPIYSPFKLDDNDGFDLGADNCIKSIYIEDKALRFELSAVLRPGRFLGNHYLAFTIPNRTFIITLDRVKEGIKAARKTKRAARALREAAKRNERWRTNKVLKSRRDRRQLLLTATSQARKQQQPVPPKSFFSRFVDGYLQAERDTSSTTSTGAANTGRTIEDTASERVTAAIRDFFGRQGQASRQGRNESSINDLGATT